MCQLVPSGVQEERFDTDDMKSVDGGGVEIVFEVGGRAWYVREVIGR